MTDPWLIRMCHRLIGCGSRFAPGWRRDEWRREWSAEVEYRVSRLEAHGRLTVIAQLQLCARCAGSAFHLLFLWTAHWEFDVLAQDIRYGLRMLWRRPLLTLFSVATLAIGIGAATAMFSAIDAVLLKSLPYPQPERLVRLYGVDQRTGQTSIGNLSVPDVMDMQRQTTLIEALGAHTAGGYFTLTGGGDPERVVRLLVTSGYFRVLGAQPALGRLFHPDDDRPNPPSVVVISHGFWARRFGGDPRIVGRSIRLSGVLATIIGVLPEAFVHPDPSIGAPEVFMLIDPDENASPRDGRYVRGIARLNSGQSLEQASAELNAIAARLASVHPTSNTGRGVLMRPLHTAVIGTSRTPLLLLQGATLIVLVIGCLNLANLLLGAATGRFAELAVRTALGASRTRISRQLLTESLILSAAGCALGLLLAWWTTTWLDARASSMLLPQQHLTWNATVVGSAILLSLAAGVGFGLVPAVHISRAIGAQTENRRVTGSRRHRRLRSLLIGVEAMLSMMLLVGAGLLIRSFHQLTQVDPGFHASHVLSFDMAVQPASYPDGNPGLFYQRVYDRLRALPGVAAVGGVNLLPLSGNYSCDNIQIEGRDVPEAQAPCAEARSASPGYFVTLGISLARGRLFTEADDELAPHIVIINETLARRFFADDDPIGRRLIYTARGQNDARDIVGVIHDVHHFGLDAPPAAEFYTPARQPPSFGLMTVVMRLAADPSVLLPAVRAAVREISPEVPVYNVRPLERVVDDSIADARFRTIVLMLFAALAVGLAGVGTYGVVALLVAQRSREMAVRRALGASGVDIARLVLSGGLRPVVLGIAAGLASSALVARAIGGLLFHVSPGDPVTYAAAAAGIFFTACIATLVPARRACRVEPIEALRQ